MNRFIKGYCSQFISLINDEVVNQRVFQEVHYRRKPWTGLSKGIAVSSLAWSTMKSLIRGYSRRFIQLLHHRWKDSSHGTLCDCSSILPMEATTEGYSNDWRRLSSARIFARTTRWDAVVLSVSEGTYYIHTHHFGREQFEPLGPQRNTIDLIVD